MTQWLIIGAAYYLVCLVFCVSTWIYSFGYLSVRNLLAFLLFGWFLAPCVLLAATVKFLLDEVLPRNIIDRRPPEREP